MSDHGSNERERREAAQKHRGEVVAGSGRALASRRIDQMVSVRLDPALLADLRVIAEQREVTLSELLREGAGLIVEHSRTVPYEVRLREIAEDQRQSVIALREHLRATLAELAETGEEATRTTLRKEPRDDEPGTAGAPGPHTRLVRA
jgi:hypothetical protein